MISTFTSQKEKVKKHPRSTEGISTVRSPLDAITWNCQEPVEGQTLFGSLAPGELVWAEVQPQPKQLHRERGETCRGDSSSRAPQTEQVKGLESQEELFMWRGNVSWGITALGLLLDDCFLTALKPLLSG